MQVQTFWQPSYTPHFSPRVSKPRNGNGVTSGTLLAYLEQNGITEKGDLLKHFGMSNTKFRHAMESLGPLVSHEQSGKGGNRFVHYWALSNPPKVEQRCTSYQAFDFFVRTGWTYAGNIPSDIISNAKYKHMCALTLEKAGKLISRVTDGTKQYRAVV